MHRHSIRFHRTIAAGLLGLAWWLAAPAGATAAATELRPQPQSAHHLEIQAIEGGWSCRTTGGDPYLFLHFDGPLDPANNILDIEYICPAGIRHVSLFSGPPLSAASEMILPPLAIAEGWIRYTADLAPYFGGQLTDQTRFLRLDFGDQSDVAFQIRQIRLRPPTEIERRRQAEAASVWDAKIATAQRIEQYLNDRTQPPLQHVAATAETILIRRTALTGLPADQVQLLEFPIDRSIGDLPAGRPLDIDPAVDPQGHWTWTLPRRDGHHDRLNSGFALAHRDAADQRLTKRTFVNDFSAFSSAPPIPAPQSPKALAGFTTGGPQDDITQLGLHAVTINVMLRSFVTNTAGPGRIAIPVEGEPVFFDPRHFAGYDRAIAQAKAHGCVVSAILLIPFNGDPTASPLYHPDADGGQYTMPDLTTARGAAVYQFVVDRFAARYHDPTSDRGAIANWILHNEIDFHSVWTNMGKQPRPVATEAYYRSMRLTHNIARQYQDSARVFVSLTHHWTVPDDGGGRNLAPREVIETLQKFSQQESDFAWGVAYHPYAQSLFAKTAWNDTQISDQFDSPLITFQNLDVLPRFLAQPHMLSSQDTPRPILLSEQGFHTADYEQETLEYQAASLLYAMDQVRRHPTIESFHYHRWIDHPGEGGLMLGLRTLPDSDHPHGRKKIAWKVLRDINTEREAAWRDRLPLPQPQPQP